MSENDLKKEYPVKSKCPIWGTPARLGISSAGRTPVWSPRAGGEYEIDNSLYNMLDLEDAKAHNNIFGNDRQKTRLTTMLVSQRRKGNNPYIDTNYIEQAKKESDLSVSERINRLLEYFSKKSKEVSIGHDLYINSVLNKDSIIMYYESLAWSESIELQEVENLANYLSEQNLLEMIDGYKSNKGFACRVTFEGYHKIEKNIVNPDSSQVFVAMWLDKSMDSAYEQGIKRAIKNAGYEPMRIDKKDKDDVDKIDDEIMEEIRKSRFLIADFTQGKDGARGSVYYEAGFAKGLGIPVIFSCHRKVIKANKLPFDTRQYKHVKWETPDDLCDLMQRRIIDFIGKGPLNSSTSP